MPIAGYLLKNWRTEESSLPRSTAALSWFTLRRLSWGGPPMQTRRAREWFWLVSARQTLPKKDSCRRQIVSDKSGQPIRDRTTSLESKSASEYVEYVWGTNYPMHQSSSSANGVLTTNINRYFRLCLRLGVLLTKIFQLKYFTYNNFSWNKSVWYYAVLLVSCRDAVMTHREDCVYRCLRWACCRASCVVCVVTTTTTPVMIWQHSTVRSHPAPVCSSWTISCLPATVTPATTRHNSACDMKVNSFSHFVVRPRLPAWFSRPTYLLHVDTTCWSRRKWIKYR